MEKRIFQSADILLPKKEYMGTWPVIACDQFTSEADYWNRLEEMYHDSISSLHTILPEAFLCEDNKEDIKNIHEHMDEYLNNDVFQEYKDSYVYVERTMTNNTIRKGLVGMLDLREYDFVPSHKTPVRASEKTVEERIPPRLKTKIGSALDISHVIVFCDDDACQIIEPLSEMKDHMIKLYDMNFNMNGGHISGWLVEGEIKEEVDRHIQIYSEKQKLKYAQPLLYAVGDGNHSLAAMKEAYRLMQDDPYALVELENIHDPMQRFEPIHRCISGIETQEFIRTLEKTFPDQKGIEIAWHTKDNAGTIHMPVKQKTEILEVLQPFLDSYLIEHQGKIDYIHGEESLKQLCQKDNTIGLELPAFESSELFSHIEAYGVFQRKAFSIGEASEKRYYMECRKMHHDLKKVIQ